MGDYIRENYRVTKGDIMSLDYGSYRYITVYAGMYTDT